MALEAPFNPVELEDLEVAFPATVDHLIPDMDSIPEAFRSGSGTGAAKLWRGFQDRWFSWGLQDTELVAKPGIDVEFAVRHLAAIQGSYGIKHQVKQASVAFLASLWLEEPIYDRNLQSPTHRERYLRDLMLILTEREPNNASKKK